MAELEPRPLSGLSVVIPTYGRVSLCEALLCSLEKSQKLCSVPSEVLVVDDSPQQKDADSIRIACARYNAQYQQYKGSVAQKRNGGARQARYDILLFIDSDCIATPQLLEAHWMSYQVGLKRDATVGSTEFVGPKSWLWQVIELTPYLGAFALAHYPMQLLWGPSNNLSCRKSVFEELRGFDERSPRPHGSEDVDFGYRLYQQGKILRTCSAAMVFHTTETWRTPQQILQRLFRWSRGEIYIKKRYWHELYYDCPSRLGITLIVAVLSLILALFSNKIRWILLPFGFLAINFVFRLLFRFFIDPKQLLTPVKSIAAEILILFYEVSTFYHCISQKLAKPLFSRVILRPEDSMNEWNQRTFQFGLSGLEILIVCIFVVYNFF